MKKIHENSWLIPGILFLLLSGLVISDATTSLDLDIYYFVLERQKPVLTVFFQWLTQMGAGLVMGVICLVVFIHNRKNGILLTISFLIMNILNGIIKSGIGRARPDVLHLTQASGYSFPSAHSMVSFCFYGLCIYLLMRSNYKYKKQGSIFIGVLIVLIGFSRIYLGVHYFSDVIGGFLISCSYLLFIINKSSFKT